MPNMVLIKVNLLIKWIHNLTLLIYVVRASKQKFIFLCV
ncbi:hypothetical protein CPTB_02224 [Corynebacterium pseudotuberculosis]|nr:hypothetical protein CPTA_01540 [Corynebacterium pseudotuberculosis]AIG10280.1 hypothetical protein CPTB_02224 [Corynebacterium pseudotuberculosis]AIG11819.1 hypothetical protein CPTC_01531 [Corynebacterium pseudotuberculosis]AKC73733.1 Hypothetical protein Cp226_1008 [Corynebacterium pseudotuberculosis]ATQ65309.1 Hypothetical protein CpPA07_1003 [Corynebacterium pseudotuberculosis]